MKEELQANLITKYLCGFSTPQEAEFLENWLKTNPSHQMFFGFVKQKLQDISVKVS
jgi:hypothetical protein